MSKSKPRKSRPKVKPNKTLEFIYRPEKPIYSQESLVRATAEARQEGFNRGKKETEEKLNAFVNGAKIKALESAAKAVDAIAHMMGEIR